MQGLEVFWGSGYKTPNVTKRPKQNAQLQNAQCNKTPNVTKGHLQNAHRYKTAKCYKTPNVTKRQK